MYVEYWEKLTIYLVLIVTYNGDWFREKNELQDTVKYM